MKHITFTLIFLYSINFLYAQTPPAKTWYYNNSGEKMGVKERWYEDSDGRRHGKYLAYLPNGQWKANGNFDHGKKSGVFREMVSKRGGGLVGNTICEIHEKKFLADKLTGKYTIKNCDGQVKSTGYYENDLKNGIFKVNGEEFDFKQYSTGQYKNGLREGVWNNVALNDIYFRYVCNPDERMQNGLKMYSLSYRTNQIMVGSTFRQISEPKQGFKIIYKKDVPVECYNKEGEEMISLAIENYIQNQLKYSQSYFTTLTVFKKFPDHDYSIKQKEKLINQIMEGKKVSEEDLLFIIEKYPNFKHTYKLKRKFKQLKDSKQLVIDRKKYLEKSRNGDLNALIKYMKTDPNNPPSDYDEIYAIYKLKDGNHMLYSSNMLKELILLHIEEGDGRSLLIELIESTSNFKGGTEKLFSIDIENSQIIEIRNQRHHFLFSKDNYIYAYYNGYYKSGNNAKEVKIFHEGNEINPERFNMSELPNQSAYEKAATFKYYYIYIRHLSDGTTISDILFLIVLNLRLPPEEKTESYNILKEQIENSRFVNERGTKYPLSANGAKSISLGFLEWANENYQEALKSFNGLKDGDIKIYFSGIQKTETFSNHSKYLKNVCKSYFEELSNFQLELPNQKDMYKKIKKL